MGTMWLAKIRFLHKECIWSPLTKKYNVVDLFYAITEYKEKDKICLVAAHILKGDEKNIKKFINDVKKDKRVKKIQTKGNFMISFVKEKFSDVQRDIFSKFYNPAIFPIKPVIVKDGYELWEIASWEKKYLTDCINIAMKHMDGELLQIQKKELEDIYLPHLMPKLSKNQRRAIDLAIEKGYYEFPRKINLIGLARLMKVSYPTLQEHLRKAERKVIPKFLKI